MAPTFLRGYWVSIYQELHMFMAEELAEVGKAGPLRLPVPLGWRSQCWIGLIYVQLMQTP